MSRIKVCVFFAAMLFAATVVAQSPVTFYIGGSLGYNSYSLSDVNDEIRAIGDVSGLGSDEINGGIGYQIEGGLSLRSGISFGLGYERMTGKSEISDNTGGIEYSTPANAIFGTFEYALPTHSAFGVSLGASIGKISTAGGVRLWVTGEGSAAADFEGSGLYGEGRLIGNFAAGKFFVFSPSIGYRVANISEIQIQNEVIYKDDGSKVELDYGGFTAHLGLKLMFGGTGR